MGKHNKPTNRSKIPFKKTILEVGILSLFKYYQTSSKKRGYDFQLTFDDFKKYLFNNCGYCGRGPSNTFKRSLKPGSKNIRDHFKYNGIDRKNNSLGYSIDNCVTCCGECNTLKMDRNSEEFLELIQDIVSNQKSKNIISEKKLNYYHTRALATSSASPDTSTKVGALLIHGESGAVICEGYNGFIRGAEDEKIPTTRPEKYDYIIHAETNLLCNAVRHGISTANCSIYCTISPCVKCMRMLYQAGIKEVYVKGFYSDFEKCSTMLDLSLSVTTQGEFSRIEIKPKRST